MHTLHVVLLFVTVTSFAQKNYDNNTKAISQSLEGKQLSGYVTEFDFDRETVRRGWWSYAREFGTPLDMRTYYKVTVPADNTDGNVDLEIFTQSVGEGKSVSFFLGVENKKYREQAELMLLDFKKMFYIQDLLTSIESKQEEADSLGKRYKQEDSKKERQQILKQVKGLELEIEKLKSWIKEIERK